MIWRLEYENAHGDVARLDIQRGAATPVETIEGTENPFLLSYELEDKNKKGFVMSSFADISIYETATFNIDDLKTLDETALSVKWYINSVLEWTGFVVPDFFSRTIGEPAIVNLAASDRLSSLEDATLDGLSEYVKIKDLAIACLAKTGLSLPLISTVDFKTGTTNVMDVFARSERLEDDKGKKISCYDVLRSILVLTNSTIRQRKGQWRIYNKIQHEAVAPTLTFNEVHQGAKRTIQPVFSNVGAFQEFGGIRTYPKNNSFESDGLTWTPKNGFVTEFDNRDISYDPITNSMVFGEVTNQNQLINRNVVPDIFAGFENMALLSSSKIDIPFNGESEINFSFEINAKGLSEAHSGRFYVEKKIQGKASEFLSDVGTWRKEGQISHRFGKYMLEYADNIVTIKSKIEIPANANPDDYSLVVHIGGIYDRGLQINNEAIAIRSLKIIFDEKSDAKGILYRTDQLGNFSKKSDPVTTIFGDYISSGLNGYFYPYSEDDTSVLRAPSGSNLPLSKWTTATDPTAGELPILQHVTRQMSRMFGVAHNILSAVIDAKTFDPLAIVTNCAGEKYVIVAATFDFLRSTVEVELQQIAYGSLLRRDFIFSYFGGGDGDGISSIGSVSGGGSSSGGGGGGGIPQTLDLIADELFISGGNSVDLGVYARKTWVETEATAYDSARLGGQLASQYTMRDVDETITGGWTFTGKIRATNVAPKYEFFQTDVENACRWVLDGNSLQMQRLNYATGGFEGSPISIDINAPDTSFRVNPNGNVGFGVNPTERLHVAGNGLFTGNLTAVNAVLSGTLSVAQAATFGGNTGTSNFVSQMQGWRVTPQGQADFRHIFTDELQAKAFTADISQALVGSDVLTKSVAKLAQNWATTANGATSTIYVEELEGFPGFQVFAVGDRLLLRLFDRSGGGLLIKNIWATVANYVSTTNNVQRYTITVNSGGATGQTVYAGSMILDYGTSGSGVIERTVLDQQGSPYSRVSTWTGSPDNPANYTLHYQSGNLNGIANANGWGVYSQNSFLTGKLLVGDLTKVGQYMEYANGQLNIKGKITVTGGNVATKADVDAVQIGGVNLLKGTNKETTVPYRNTSKQTEYVNVERGKQYALSYDVKATGNYQGNTIVVQYYDANDTRLSTEWIEGSVTTQYQRLSKIITMPTDPALVKVSIGYRSTTPASQANTFKCLKLETGNRATDWSPAPEDVTEYVDAVQVGGRNLVEKTNQGITNIEIDSSAGSGTWTASEEIVDGVRCAKGTKNTTAVETWALFNLRIYTPSKFRANQQYTISFKMKPSFAVSNKKIRFSTITNQALTANSDTYSLLAGDWNHIKLVVTTLPDFDTILAGRATVHLRLPIDDNSSTGDTVLLKDIMIEEGNKASTYTPAPEDVPSALEYLATAIQDGSTDIAGGLVTTNLLMVKDTNGTVRGGMSGLNDNIGFWTGGSYQSATTNNANVIFRKDGSFSLADGKIIGTSDGSLSVDGGVVTGMIESSNYNGTVGSRFDLHNGHLLIGDAIRMSGDVSEIQVRNRDTGLDSFKIGDFELTTTFFTGAGVDVFLSSSSVTASPAAGSYQLNRTVYVSGSGELTTSASYYISTLLITGGAYNFHAHLKVVLSQRLTPVETVPFILVEKFAWIGGNGIKMQLKNGNAVVWEQRIREIPASGVIPLSIYTSFQAVSPSLQLIITIDGEYQYREPYGSETRFYNTTASIERFDSSSRLVLKALLARMEFSTKGMQAVFSNTNYFRCDASAIEGRGTQTFISPDGNYRLRVSNNGIQKSTNGGQNWTPL